MNEKFTIYLYKDLVKVTYNDAQALPQTLFQAYHVKKIELPGKRIIKKFIRWRIKKFIKKELLTLTAPSFEFLDIDALNYSELFHND